MIRAITAMLVLSLIAVAIALRPEMYETWWPCPLFMAIYFGAMATLARTASDCRDRMPSSTREERARFRAALSGERP